MDNYVTFRLQFESNGEKELKTLSVEAEDVRGAVKTATDEAKRFDEAVVNWTQAGQAVEQLQGCLSDLYGVLEGLSSAWEMQSSAETKQEKYHVQHFTAYDVTIDGIDYVLKCEVKKNDRGLTEHPYSFKKKENP